MSLKHKLKARFFHLQREKFQLDEATLTLGIQLGWFEKFFGKWILTERGEKELAALIQRNTTTKKAA